MILLILRLPHVPRKPLTIRQQIGQLDPLGTICFLPSITCLILALQWGGTKYQWGDARIIALLVVFGILIVAFIAIQIWKGEDATIPPRIISQRSIAFGFFCMICSAASMMVLVYYLPIYFQAIKDTTAIQSGIRTIPLVFSLITGNMMAAMLISRVGYYTAPLIASALIVPIGSGLMTTLNLNTGHAKWIGYQILAGYGIGLGMQQPSLAAQTVLSQSDVSIGSSIMFFAQQLSGAIFLAVGQNVFTQRLAQNLAGTPGLDLEAILNAGATDLRTIVAPQFLHGVLVAYNDALRQAFVLGTAMASLMILGAVGVEWRSVNKDKMKLVPDREATVESGEKPTEQVGAIEGKTRDTESQSKVEEAKGT